MKWMSLKLLKYKATTLEQAHLLEEFRLESRHRYRIQREVRPGGGGFSVVMGLARQRIYSEWSRAPT
jgi:hypothetical protein